MISPCCSTIGIPKLTCSQTSSMEKGSALVRLTTTINAKQICIFQLVYNGYVKNFHYKAGSKRSFNRARKRLSKILVPVTPSLNSLNMDSALFRKKPFNK